MAEKNHPLIPGLGLDVRRTAISYIVHNLTKKTIVLSDLRAEIGPHKMLDLEKVADWHVIDRSYDLRLALDTKRLRLCSQGVISRTSKPEVHVVEKLVEKHHHHEQKTLDEQRLLALMRRVMQENQPVPVSGHDKVLEAVDLLRQKIETMGGEVSEEDILSIDPAELANLQSRAIDKISESIETSVKKSENKVVLKDTGLTELANELE